MKLKLSFIIISAFIALTACTTTDDAGTAGDIVTDSGLKITVHEQGSGNSPQPGDIVSVHYTGQLDDGTIFDSSDGGDPITFPLGQGT